MMSSTSADASTAKRASTRRSCTAAAAAATTAQGVRPMAIVDATRSSEGDRHCRAHGRRLSRSPSTVNGPDEPLTVSALATLNSIDICSVADT
jgi:hypothetical protein